MTADPADREAARAWLTEHATLSLDDLLAAVRDIYGDGASIGFSAAAQATGTLIPGAGEHVTDWTAFWDSWAPGNADAASLLNAGGLADLLDNANVTVRGIAGTTLDRLGNLLADGAASGESVEAIASSLVDVLHDTDRAYRIATTELARAVSQASLDGYARNDVARYELITSPGACPLCLDTAADGPFDVDDLEGMPPLHPTCRCAVSPVTA